MAWDFPVPLGEGDEKVTVGELASIRNRADDADTGEIERAPRNERSPCSAF